MPLKKTDTFTLREKKYAKTKIALAKEFRKRLQKVRFADIAIKEVCEKVEVSEGTFYNYFPHKTDIVYFFNKLTVLKLIWITGHKGTPQADARDTIAFAFDYMAQEMQNPFLFFEIISLYTSERVKPDGKVDLSVPEKVYGLPDCPGIEEVALMPLEDFFLIQVKRAQQKGQMTSRVPAKEIMLSLMAILVGVPLVIDMNDFGKLKKLFRTQLSVFWTGLADIKRKA